MKLSNIIYLYFYFLTTTCENPSIQIKFFSILIFDSQLLHDLISFDLHALLLLILDSF